MLLLDSVVSLTVWQVKTIKSAIFAGSFDAVPKSRKELLFVTLYAVRNLIGEAGGIRWDETVGHYGYILYGMA